MEQKNNKSLIAMILGIAAVVLSILCDSTVLGNPMVNLIMVFVALGIGIAAIVMAVKGRKEDPENKGMATAGLVTGIIGVVFSGISVICVISCVVCVASIASQAGTSLNELNDLANQLSSLQ